jgi:Fur family zinc uptake transcriptional regulator
MTQRLEDVPMASNSKAAAASGTTATKTGVPKAATRRGRPPREGLSHWQQRVLDLVRASTEPSSAYDILREMKDDGITAPPVVYRALKGLLDRGLVHRIESLNAYVVCGGADHPHHHPAQFAICRECGRVEEITDPAVDQLIGAWTGRIGFVADSRTIEILGRCQDCVARLAAVAAD